MKEKILSFDDLDMTEDEYSEYDEYDESENIEELEYDEEGGMMEEY